MGEEYWGGYPEEDRDDDGLFAGLNRDDWARGCTASDSSMWALLVTTIVVLLVVNLRRTKKVR